MALDEPGEPGAGGRWEEAGGQAGRREVGRVKESDCDRRVGLGGKIYTGEERRKRGDRSRMVQEI